MIEINLVPKDLRKKRKAPLWGGNDVPMEVVFGSLGAGLFLLIVIHLVFIGVNMGRLTYYKALQKDWEKIQPEQKEIDDIFNEKSVLDTQYQKIQGLIGGKKRIFWFQKLNILSDALPKGVWLTELEMNINQFMIKGSAIARQDTEMTNVHSLFSSLKNDAVFTDQLGQLDLSSIKKRMIGSTEVADFLIDVEFKKNDRPK
ncbi:MAG: PilN domain-containing protein [Candidatus Omnitrophica bacterium]|nr:PilN domain-containing protein [Candidatus Omnitrophota bacterium]